MSRRNPVVRGEYPLTRRQLSFAKGNKAVGFIRMDPATFLKLTTSTNDQMERIRKKARDYRDYAKFMLKEVQPPLLFIERSTGQIKGHEGRHRMAAGEKAAARIGRKVKPWVAIFLKDDDGRTHYYDSLPGFERRYLTRKDIPTRLVGEFRPTFATIKTTPFIPVHAPRRVKKC